MNSRSGAEEYIERWFLEPEYHFSEQDEDLIIAEVSLIPKLEILLASSSMPIEKKMEAISALMVLVQDDLIDDSGKLDLVLLKRISTIIRNHSDVAAAAMKELRCGGDLLLSILHKPFPHFSFLSGDQVQ